jgi:hypothetical protein
VNQLVQGEGVRAVVTMNQPVELLPNFLSTPVTPGTSGEAARASGGLLRGVYVLLLCS